MWSVVILLGSCRGGGLPAQPEKSDAEADTALAHALLDQFPVAEVNLTRTAKVVGLSLVDSTFLQLPDSMRRARATTLARWTWHHLAHPAGITRIWVWASAPGPENGPQTAALYSYWTRELEPESTSSQPR